MKTDLAKTLSIRGQHGLFTYIAQSRGGAIVEALEDKKRYNFSASAGITTLANTTPNIMNMGRSILVPAFSPLLLA